MIVESLVRLAALFFLAAGLQHMLMRIASANLARAQEMPLLGKTLGAPAVMLHEVLGHLIPALLSGSRVKSVVIGEREGHVAVTYEKNIFGFVSVLIMGFGPGIALPLLFLLLALLAGGYAPVEFIQNGEFVGKFILLMKGIFALDGPLDYLLIYLMAIIVPGAAASTGDLLSVFTFVRSAPVFTLLCIAFITIVLVASGEAGVMAADYASLLVLNSFATFACIYLPGLAIQVIVVQGWKRGSYAHAAAAIGASFAALTYMLPAGMVWARVPLSLLLGCLAVFIRGRRTG
ncbi:MAG: hypothetical protein N3H30_01725 [Candidatus Micrarchaeota archaeon]|nr:hypothetical protein [Candidatus Micrarchaeota archaeon]